MPFLCHSVQFHSFQQVWSVAKYSSDTLNSDSDTLNSDSDIPSVDSDEVKEQSDTNVQSDYLIVNSNIERVWKFWNYFTIGSS